MAAATKPFDPDATCPKCLHDDIHTQFSNGRNSWNGGCYDCQGSWSGEHMDRRCRRCNYRWIEMTADAATSAAPEEPAP